MRPIPPISFSPLVYILADLLFLGFNVLVNFLYRVTADLFFRSIVGSFAVLVLGRIHD
jgi:hypothetical protein